MHANGNVWAAGKGVNEYVGENNHHSINYSPSAHLHWLYGLGVSGNWLRLEISIELEPQPKFVLASQSLGYGDGEWRRENLINIHTNWWSLSLNWINFSLEISISFNTHYYHCWCEALRHVTSRCEWGYSIACHNPETEPAGDTPSANTISVCSHTNGSHIRPSDLVWPPTKYGYIQ